MKRKASQLLQNTQAEANRHNLNCSHLRDILVKLHGEMSFLRSSTCQIPSFLWNLTFHYHFQKNPPSVPVLRDMNPAHSLTPYLYDIHLKYPPTYASSPKLPVSLQLLRLKMCMHFSSLHACYMSCDWTFVCPRDLQKTVICCFSGYFTVLYQLNPSCNVG